MIFAKIEELEKQKNLCNLFLEAYDVIVGSRKSEIDIIKDAEEYSLKDNALNNAGNNSKYKKVEKQIKRYYLHLSYAKFSEIAEDSLHFDEILLSIKREILKKENYKSFIDCGLRVSEDFELTKKEFYADYVFATIKVPELEAMIKLENENRKRKI